ncbi:hypothetical protein [Pannonibacter carbonis]|nr:hypothetical protein [Pannonibacter carbonis]
MMRGGRLQSLAQLARQLVRLASVSCALAAVIAALLAVGLHTKGWLQPI